jgi:hypothetical protein
MPPHIIKDLPPKRKKTNSKIWHQWMKEKQRRNRVEQLKLVAKNLAVNAVVASEVEEDALD